MMEDSGFDSGEKVACYMQNYKNSNVESDNSSGEEILNVSVTSNLGNIDDLVCRNPSIINPTQTSTGDISLISKVPTRVQKEPLPHHHLNEHNKKLSKINTCKGLQRKLEQKVERAKKNFFQNEKCNQMENDIVIRKPTNLISISRLPFPRNIESQRLVEYKSDNSDDDEVATFFPVQKRKTRRKQTKHKEELDTFSIQEMTIIESDSNDGDKSSDEDDCDSQLNLELPTRTDQSFVEKIRQVICCARSAQGIF